jgi:peptidoglycan/LPS O-acetylase OafA/YrhL
VALIFFFALSGFVLYLPYVQRLASGRERPSTASYLKNRVLRIFPVYLVIFIVANFVMHATYVENSLKVGWGKEGPGIGEITNPLDLLANMTLTHTLFPGTIQTGINPSWSLTAEWGFYLLLPVIGMAIFALARNARSPLRAAAWPALVLFVMGVTVNTTVVVLQVKYFPNAVLEGYWGANWIAVLSRSFFALADTFAYGMFAAVIYVALANGALKSISTFRLQFVLGLAMLTGVAVSMVFYVFEPRYLHTVFGFAAGAFLLLITAAIARNEHSAIASITDWRPLRLLGMMGLSFYLWHYPVVLSVHRLGLPIRDSVGGLAIAYALTLSITVGLSWLTYRFVELPAMRHRA